jgi:hypothetical protein
MTWFGMTKKRANLVVMLNLVLNLFQHLVCFFLPSTDTSFITVPAYRQAATGLGFQIRSNNRMGRLQTRIVKSEGLPDMAI